MSGPKVGCGGSQARRAAALLTLSVLAGNTGAQTANLEIRLMAASCAACHGFDGKSTGVGLPLAGQSAEALTAKLLGFKSGSIKSTVMQQHAKGYTDPELTSLAEHFSKIK
ncbi:MAG: c-type cytochrome [Betaproteobacteria bacterium]|nr:c-type cytochrome [Betaproteobacteria bacterium]